MKSKNIALSLLFIVSGCGFFRTSDPKITSLEPVVFSPQAPETWDLPSGIKVLYLPDDELPFISATLTMRGGGLWEAESEKGNVALMGALLAGGGAGMRTADEFDRELVRLSASVSSSFGPEFGTVSFSCLQPDINTVFGLFSDVIFRPKFEQSRIDLSKGKALEGIRRRKDDPSTVAIMSFNQLIYGKSSPYGKVMESDDLRKIKRENLLDVYKKFVHPKGALLTVTGKITKDELNELLNKEFAVWRSPNETERVPPPLGPEPRPAIYFIESKVSQATIIAGHRGVPRRTDDEIAIAGWNELVGGGIELSRLVDKVRTEKGYAYDVSAGIYPGLLAGSNIIFLQTKIQSAGDALVESLGVLEDLQKNMISEDEMLNMKRAAVNAFVFAFDSPSSVLSRKASQYLYGYPDDYDAKYAGRVMSLAPADIKEVANRRWDSQKLVIVVVGDKEVYKRISAVLPKLPVQVRSQPIKIVNFDESLKGIQ
jgi:zinc protease